MNLKEKKGRQVDMEESRIAEKIYQARQERRLTQEEFASRLGVTPQAVSRWERGNGLPDIAMVSGICEILQLDANELLGVKVEKISEEDDYCRKKEIQDSLIADPLVLDVGMDLVSCVAEGIKTDYVNRTRKGLAEQFGILLPVLRIRDNINLQPKEIQILSYDRLLFDKVYEENGVQTYRELIDETARVCRENYSGILNKHLVKIMVDNLERHYPGTVADVIPEKISYLQMLSILREEYDKKRNLRDFIGIVERAEKHAEGYLEKEKA